MMNATFRSSKDSCAGPSAHGKDRRPWRAFRSFLPALLVLWLALSPLAAADEAIAALSPTAQNHSAAFSDSYRIGVDDMVQVAVWRNPELSITVPVRPDGRISVPLVGDVVAGGRIPSEVAADIELKLAQYVRDPKVAVILTELKSHEFISRVRVTGAVRNPVSIPFRQGMTVLDAVLQAGGTNEFASADKTKLFRKSRDGSSTRTIDVKLKAILQKGELGTNIPVEPGDVITVPERIL